MAQQDERETSLIEVAKKLGIKPNIPSDTVSIDPVQYLEKLSDDQKSLLKTLARTISRAHERIFRCSRCNRRFRIPNAKQNQYECPSCKIPMDEILHGRGATQEIDHAELVLDESVPKEVQTAISDPKNIFGKFVIVQKLGEGAMGSVHKAFDVQLGRFVALKFIKSQQMDELRLEARTLASLEHKNIARIYEVGTARGVTFIAMQMIDGKPLSDVKLETRRALAVMQLVCEAVDFAHKHGFIHRDLKPENVMLDKYGNPFVMDFGLATNKAQAGQIAGTPAYMAPEIALQKPASTRSDVYSLGATLYQMLTGKPPLEFPEDSDFDTVLARIQEGKITPIRNLLPKIPRELEAIVNKALEFHEKDRYQTAHDMGNDIRRYLNGLPVSAYSNSRWYKLRKAVMRNKLLTSVIAVALLAIAFFAVILYDMYTAAKEEEMKTQAALEKSAKAAEQAKMEAARRKFAEEKADKIAKAFFESFKTAKEKILEMRVAGYPYESYAFLLESAKQIHDIAIEFGSTDAKIHCDMGFLFRLVGGADNREKALKEQEEALKENAKLAEALYEKAILRSAQYEERMDTLMAIWHKQEAMRRIRRSWRTPKVEIPGFEELENMEANGSGGLEESKKETAKQIRAEVLETFKKVMKYENRGSPLWLKAKGIVSFLEGKEKEAQEAVGEALKKDPTAEECYDFLGRWAVKRKAYPNAVDIYSKGISAIKGNYQFYVSRANAYAAIMNMKCLASTNPETDYREAESMFKKADEDFTAAIALRKDFTEAIHNRGITRMNWGAHRMEHGDDPAEMFKKAIEDFEAIIKIDKTGSVLMDRGQSRMRWGIYRMKHGQDPSENFSKALEDFNDAIKKNPGNFEAWLLRGQTFNQWGIYKQDIHEDSVQEFNSAISSFDEAEKLDRTNYEVYLGRGLARAYLAKQKRRRGLEWADLILQSIGDLGSAQKLGKDNYEVWLYGAQMKLQAGLHRMQKQHDPTPMFNQAARDIEEAMKKNKGSYEVWCTKGLLKVYQGNYKLIKTEDPSKLYKEAIEAYDMAVKLNDESSEAYAGRGTARTSLLYALKSGVSKAPPNPADLLPLIVSDFNKAIKLNPNNEEAYLGRAIAEYYNGEYATSCADFEKAEKMGAFIQPRIRQLWEDAKRRR